MLSNKIIHIDYGSSGTSGLYLAQILNAYPGPIPVDAYVHSNFPKLNVCGEIFRVFDRFSKFLPGDKLQKIFKAIDLYINFILLIILLRQVSKKHKLYVFVQFFQSFHAYQFLFRRIKNYCTLVVTVHDAVELQHNYPSLIMSSRDEIINHAHYLLVHNADSASKLSYLGKRIYQIPFPPMTSDNNADSIELPENGNVRFLFIGHLRPEKGIDDLLAAWKKLSSNILDRAFLTVAGTYSSSLKLNFEGLVNCTLLLEYMNEEKFVQLIRACHYVVLPYRGGTNSGVLSIASALGRPCITTQLPIFLESPFFEELLSLAPHSDMSEFISSVVIEHPQKYNDYLIRNSFRFKRAQSDFRQSIPDLYEKIVRN
jgi:glycosyltransferase involved in cell wall biosynthesis